MESSRAGRNNSEQAAHLDEGLGKKTKETSAAGGSCRLHLEKFLREGQMEKRKKRHRPTLVHVSCKKNDEENHVEVKMLREWGNKEKGS